MSEKEVSTSFLLFDEAPLLVRPLLAVRVGLNEAIVLQQVHYWLENKKKSTKEKDLAQERTYNDGRFWTYDSYPEWQKQFPWWAVRTVERTFTNLEKKGILISGNFNRLKMDRTKWYTIDYDALDAYEKGRTKKTAENIDDESTHHDNVAECENIESDKLAECIPTQSANVAPPICQSVVSNLPTCGEQSANLWSPIPKTSSKTSTETANEDSLNSSSSIEVGKHEYIKTELTSKEEEEEVKDNLVYLGGEIASSKIMRTNKQINDTLKLMIENDILCFDRVDVQRAIIHYKDECVKRETIGKPPTFFVNGFEMKWNERHSTGIGNDEREQKSSVSNNSTNKVPFYNWLEERD